MSSVQIGAVVYEFLSSQAVVLSLPIQTYVVLSVNPRYNCFTCVNP